MKNKTTKKRLEVVPIIYDFPEVFPEELLGLPPSRQVEFQINLVSEAAPVARAPYRLALSEMRELSELCTEFERLMKDKFHMSSVGELTFFLGLQVKQKEDEIVISQDKYVADVLRKFNFSDVKSASTPVDMERTLVKDADGDNVDVHLYKSMIRSLMYLTTSRPDI
nr:ribonuclease H-like domain, reverse transcriptase, RNA-dependent DNA polymerase [Tanacetum cinerariifolium]